MKLEEIQKSLGIRFGDPALLQEAITHRSYLNETKGTLSSNERLEFLGDSILSFIISRFLFKNYPKLPEGELTNLRSAVVRTEMLAKVAEQLGLGNYLLLSRGEEDGGGRRNISLLADTFEALVGAMFLDRGLEETVIFVEKLLTPKLPEIVSSGNYLDYKSELQEKVQAKYRISPVYKVIGEEGPDHAKVFHIAVFVQDIEEGSGSGRSKQEAEQEAAHAALEKWR